MIRNVKEAVKNQVWLAGIFILSGLIYLKTICPTVEFIDSGELAVNCALLGIAHPTGYPLYTLLGKLAVMLFPGEVIFRCNLLSLVITSVSACFLYLLIIKVLPKSYLIKPTAASISLFMAFSPVFWSQGTANEVYCVTLLADLIAILFFVSYINLSKTKYLLAGFYIWGLSFGSHMSTVFLLPAIIYMIYTTDGFKGLFKTRYYYALFFLLIALSAYIYLPIRSSFEPFLNWSNPTGFEGIINHISGWQYQVWMFKSPAQMIEGIGYFFKLLYMQFGVIGMILTVIGMIYLSRKRLKISLFLIIIVLADIFYSSNYDIIDIDSYYLLGFAVLSIFTSAGLIYLINKIAVISSVKSHQKIIKAFIIFTLIALPLSNLTDNFFEQDKSRKTYAADGVENILASMAENGIAIIENWDFYSPWLYYRYILNIRPDAVIIDKELLRRSWYLDFLKRYHPDVVGQSEKQINRFIELVKPFEAIKQHDPQALTHAFREMISSIINSNRINRPIYTNILNDPDVAPNLARIPVGVIFKLEENIDYVEFDIDKIDISSWETSFIHIDK